MGSKPPGERKSPKEKTPTFLLELPLQVEAGQARRLRAHLEVGRQFYNAVLSEGQKRLRRMRADPAWQEARAIPRAQKQQRRAAFSALRERYRFSEADLHVYGKEARVSFLADHLDAVLNASRQALRDNGTMGKSMWKIEEKEGTYDSPNHFTPIRYSHPC